MTRRRVVVLTGAGISAESGLKTFRDSGGLWENHDIMEVASPEGWHKNPALVLDFYNQRRKQLTTAEPNAAHQALVHLEQYYDVHIITQNVDDLHERAGSTNVLHLHGELKKMRSSIDPAIVMDCPGDIKLGDKCPLGSQLRPQVVWFGEEVPMMIDAMEIAHTADIFMVVGTSMVVYPAAGLIQYVPKEHQKYIIDPSTPEVGYIKNVTFIAEKASTGVPKVVRQLIEEAEG